MVPKISFWEKSTIFRPTDVAIVGSGIVGLSTAIFLKKHRPDWNIVIIERYSHPQGASTRNAGFACIGSPTELLADIEEVGFDQVQKIVKLRAAGLSLLQQMIDPISIDFHRYGGYEVFEDSDCFDKVKAELSMLNGLVAPIVGHPDHFTESTTPIAHSISPSYQMIFNNYEGQLHPGKMMEALLFSAQKLGVRFILNASVDSYQSTISNVVLSVNNSLNIKAKKLVLCTNGFTNEIAKIPDLNPARNCVLVTEPVPNLNLKGCFHFNQGYVYFRNIGNRILIGGMRNIDMETEKTSNFGINKKIELHLIEFLQKMFGIRVPIDMKWSGIMGVGPSKEPIIKELESNVYAAIRLGGMGVAIGTKVGQKAAKMIIES